MKRAWRKARGWFRRERIISEGRITYATHPIVLVVDNNREAWTVVDYTEFKADISNHT